jgi:hypothetical protein
MPLSHVEITIGVKGAGASAFIFENDKAESPNELILRKCLRFIFYFKDKKVDRRKWFRFMYAILFFVAEINKEANTKFLIVFLVFKDKILKWQIY